MLSLRYLSKCPKGTHLGEEGTYSQPMSSLPSYQDPPELTHYTPPYLITPTTAQAQQKGANNHMLSKESDVQGTPTFRDTLFSAQIFQFLVNLFNVGHLHPQRTQFSPCKEG